MTVRDKELAPGQVWECHRGRHTGARFRVVARDNEDPDWWTVESLTARHQPLRVVYWPDLAPVYSLLADS